MNENVRIGEKAHFNELIIRLFKFFLWHSVL